MGGSSHPAPARPALLEIAASRISSKSVAEGQGMPQHERAQGHWTALPRTLSQKGSFESKACRAQEELDSIRYPPEKYGNASIRMVIPATPIGDVHFLIEKIQVVSLDIAASLVRNSDTTFSFELGGQRWAWHRERLCSRRRVCKDDKLCPVEPVKLITRNLEFSASISSKRRHLGIKFKAPDSAVPGITKAAAKLDSFLRPAPGPEQKAEEQSHNSMLVISGIQPGSSGLHPRHLQGRQPQGGAAEGQLQDEGGVQAERRRAARAPGTSEQTKTLHSQVGIGRCCPKPSLT